MNIAYEFSKIKDAFAKVKADTNFISKKISENYENFMREHYKLTQEVKTLANEIKVHSDFIKENHLSEDSNVSEKELEDLKYIVKDLKKEIKSTQKENSKIHKVVEELKKGSSNYKELKEKLQSNELEIYLLKEKLNERDQEMAQMKEVNIHLFNLVSELSKLEIDLEKKSLAKKIKK